MTLRRFVFTFLSCCWLAAAQSLPAQSLDLLPLGTAKAWTRSEFRLAKVPEASNPFDPEAIRVDATFTSPSGVVTTVPAFWFQEYRRDLVDGAEVLVPVGKPEWRIRFTPTETGSYALMVAVALNGAPAENRGSLRFDVGAPKPEVSRGWVRTRPDHRYFETSDGKPLRLVGENVCWAVSRGLSDFEGWFSSMQQSGQNFARLWCSPWWIPLEHRPNTLNRYALDAAWQLDRLFELAEQHGIFLLLAFDHHGMFQVENQNWGGSNNFWKTNPYNQLLGGPCATPNDFFTDAKAQALYQKRLRYLIARYGYSPHLLAWQFFNEIDNVYAPRQSLKGPDVAAWHGVMGKWLHAHDPYHHLVTTSLTGGSDRPEIWTLPEMDFAVYHSYADPSPAKTIAAVSDDFIQRYQKPVMVGEFGVSARDWAIASDPHLRGFRQAIWGSALSGTVGTAMSWWWEEIHADSAYPLYQSLSKILTAGGWHVGDWAPAAIAGNRTPPNDLGERLPDGPDFNASLALSSYQRRPISWDVAVANPLSAARASEAISSYLLGSIDAARQRPVRLTGIFNKDGKLSFHVNSVASDVELIVQVDGAETLRTRFFDRDGQASVNREIDRELSVPIPPGKHVIQILNTGIDWVNLDSLQLNGLRTASYAGGWQFGPEVVGLRNSAAKRAVLYLYSPYIAYPAGAFRYHPPRLEQQSVTLNDWPEGTFTAQWYDPQTGGEVAHTQVTSTRGTLTLVAPPFEEDLAVIVAPSPGSAKP